MILQEIHHGISNKKLSSLAEIGNVKNHYKWKITYEIKFWFHFPIENKYLTQKKKSYFDKLCDFEKVTSRLVNFKPLEHESHQIYGNDSNHTGMVWNHQVWRWPSQNHKFRQKIIFFFCVRYLFSIGKWNQNFISYVIFHLKWFLT